MLDWFLLMIQDKWRTEIAEYCKFSVVVNNEKFWGFIYLSVLFLHELLQQHGER